MKRKIKLCGRLGEAGFGPYLEAALEPGMTAAQALSRLRLAFGAQAGLLRGAVLATDSRVLRPADPLPNSKRLAALPPVCGG